jgi:hypothetical protein
MTEFRDLSRLPADQHYWDQLESRITGELGPLVRESVRRPAWWSPLARRAWWLGGIAAAAALGALWLLPARPSPGAAAPSGFLKPPDNDPTLVAFVAAPSPPSVGALMLTTPGPAR